jgi:cysteine-S-conjugate beta-lyase
MKYNFDTYINRKKTDCFKWDFGKYSKPGMIPMWVADMDFCSPPEILEALHRRIDHGIFGYTFQPAELVEVVIERLKRLYNWDIESEWLVWLPGLVTGFNVACRAFASENDNIATAIPVYYPFLQAPRNNNQSIIKIPVIKENNRWTLDFELIENLVSRKTKMFLFCNPHNPGGTMFAKDELLKFADICERNDIIICSDEIHCDLILDKTKSHIPIASLSPDIAKRTITLMAPSKTFNIAGLGCSFAIISDKKLRAEYIAAMAGLVPHANILGYTAALAAYKHGDEWLAELLDYLRENFKLIQEYVDKMPGFSISKHEATYLAWIDVSKSGIKNPVKFFENVGVGFSNGASFGGRGFIRMNFGCPRSVLKEALERAYNAVSKMHLVF